MMKYARDPTTAFRNGATSAPYWMRSLTSGWRPSATPWPLIAAWIICSYWLKCSAPADEVLFGKLKNGAHVRVVVTKEADGEDGASDKAAQDKLSFEFLDGPVVPKPEKI